MKLLRSLLPGLALMAGPGLFAQPPAVSSPAQKAAAQIRDFYRGATDAFDLRDTNNQPPEPDQAIPFARSMLPDGHWADINYQSAARSGWPPAIHYTRMTAMATAAAAPAIPEALRTELLVATHRAFAYWIQHDFQCPNWWYNEIGTPKLLGLCALLLGNQLSGRERNYVAGIISARSKIARTGQNRVWLAGNTLMGGLLRNDESAIRPAAEAIWSEVHVSTDEGIQPDFSFHQHGPQQQFGNYGMAFAVEVARWALFLRGTPWALPPGPRLILRHYLLDGLNWTSWRGAMDISACGRQFMPRQTRTKSTTIAMVMKLAACFDPEEATAYRAFVTRNQPGAASDLIGNRVFWRSDYIVHRRPGFAATLKLSSHRVIGAELVNSENLSGYHTADGALYVYATGDEYEDIFPVWDWRKLPGVTCAQMAPPPFKTSSVPADFVGGVSDGTRGCAALDYFRDGVTARKAWFFGEEAVVCLGQGISGLADSGIATTIEQSLLHGPVHVTTQAREELISPDTHVTRTDVVSIEHAGWRYTLLSPATVHLDIAPVTGNWHRVFSNPETPAGDVTRNVFLLWLDHGVNPKNADYAYAISPAAAHPRFKVLVNSSEIQAVEFGDRQVGVVFWAAGNMILSDGRRLGVDQPCLVLTNGNRICVSDPTQKLGHLNLTLDGRISLVAFPSGATQEIDPHGRGD